MTVEPAEPTADPIAAPVPHVPGVGTIGGRVGARIEVKKLSKVYLHNGSQDYDLMGFTQDQITRDVLDQFESHRQLLGRVYS